MLTRNFTIRFFNADDVECASKVTRRMCNIDEAIALARQHIVAHNIDVSYITILNCASWQTKRIKI